MSAPETLDLHPLLHGSLHYLASLFLAGTFIWTLSTLGFQRNGPNTAKKEPPNLPTAIPGGNIIRLIRGIDVLASAIM